ncbi:MAG: hypothetical protein ABIG30_00110 [Candidatus Aenigmatarchaeota archaeon]
MKHRIKRYGFFDFFRNWKQDNFRSAFATDLDETAERHPIIFALYRMSHDRFFYDGFGGWA